MGQKYHPLGLRLGLHRKWNTSWYSPLVIFSQNAVPASGSVQRRGGIRQSGRETLLQTLVRRAPRSLYSHASSVENSNSRISNETAPRLLPVDLHIEIGTGGSLFFLLFYAKRREPGVAALFFLMTTHPSTFIATSRISTPSELLSAYSSREKLLYAQVGPSLGFSVQSTTLFGTSEYLPISLGASFGTALQSGSVELFRARAPFLRRLRLSRSQVFSPAPAFKSVFHSSTPVRQRGLSQRLAYAALLSPSGSRFAPSWSTGITASARRSTPSELFPTLSNLTGVSIHFLGLNALSLARYGRDQEVFSRNQTGASALALNPSRERSSPSRAFLQQRETERGSRYASIAAALPDLLRLTFLSLYLKKAPFLARILAHSLTTLPRNRKETLFLRFLRKLVKVFAAQRPERLGIRLRVQGRVNRWRRTKHRVGERGRLPLYSYSARLEYGEAQALTRKGALGFRLWFAYHPGFAHRYRRTLFAYLRRSTLI